MMKCFEMGGVYVSWMRCGRSIVIRILWMKKKEKGKRVEIKKTKWNSADRGQSNCESFGKPWKGEQKYRIATVHTVCHIHKNTCK